MRGLLLFFCFKFFRIGITPAYAGTTHQLQLLRVHLQDHPCICGDYRFTFQKGTKSEGSPLHMRGLQAGKSFLALIIGITPAYAGTTSAFALALIMLWDHPCICGDYSSKIQRQSLVLGSPLHMRGLLFLLFFACFF